MNKRITMLYKYCKWDENAKQNIDNNYIYPCKSNSENDPFENSPCFDKAKWIMQIANVQHLPIRIVKANIDDYFDDFLEHVRSHTFIISLTSSKANPLMWSHYSDGHKGICIGYDVSKIVKESNHLNKVVYSNERVEWPCVMFGAKKKDWEKYGLEQIVFRTAYTKSKDWAYEKEYRIVSTDYGNENDFVEKRAMVKEIYIGCEVPDKKVKDIIAFVKKLNRNIKIFHMQKDSKLFSLIPKPVQ